MFRSIIIGNLGSDAHVETNNGRPFVSFSVAHNDRFTREDGTVKDTTQWISCAMNGDGGNLLPYLKKGRQIYVEGRTTLRCFSSEKERRWVAGANISVDHLELIGAGTDEVPRILHDKEGLMHNVSKAYFLQASEAQAILNGQQQEELVSASGEVFTLHAPCWVRPAAEQAPAPATQDEVFDGEDTDNETKEMQQKMSNKRSNKK